MSIDITNHRTTIASVKQFLEAHAASVTPKQFGTLVKHLSLAYEIQGVDRPRYHAIRTITHYTAQA